MFFTDKDIEIILWALEVHHTLCEDDFDDLSNGRDDAIEARRYLILKLIERFKEEHTVSEKFMREMEEE